MSALMDEWDETEQAYIKRIKILEKRLHDSKQKNREEKLKLKYDLNKAVEYGRKQRDKLIKATKFEYDETSGDGLIYFSNNIRTYLLSGLKHIKSCAKCLEHTCPNEFRYKKDKNGEFIKKVESLGSNSYIWTGYEEVPREEYLKEWGSCVSKMIKALKLKEKYFDSSDWYMLNDKDKEKIEEKIKEGMELLIKYQNEFLY